MIERIRAPYKGPYFLYNTGKTLQVVEFLHS